MRKRSCYRPRPVLQDPVNWVLGGFRPLTDLREANTVLRTRNHLALAAVTQGRATGDDVNTLITASNMTTALTREGFGKAYRDIARAGADAVEALRNRQRKVCTGPELTAIKVMMELHDKQLDVVRIMDLDAALKVARSKQSEAV